MTKTKPIGAGTRNLTANVTDTLYNKVDKLARSSGCKLGEYVRAVLEHAADRNLQVRDIPRDIAAREEALRLGKHPLPRVGKEVVPAGELKSAARRVSPLRSRRRA